MTSNDYLSQKWKLMFQFFDRDGDGILSLEEFMFLPCELLKQSKFEKGVEVARAHQGYWERVLQAANRQSDCLAIREEDWLRGQLIVGQSSWFQNDFIHGLTKVLFDTMDLDGDNLISIEEWRQYYHRFGEKDEKVIETTFAKMDTNGDGFISRQEYDHALKTFVTCQQLGDDYSFLYKRL